MVSSRRIDRGVARPGRRPTASQDFPVRIHVGQSPSETVLEIDGRPLNWVKRCAFTAELDPKTGKVKQKLSLVLFDKQEQQLRVETVDRLHEMTEGDPDFDLELDIIPVPGDMDAAGQAE